MFCIDIEYVDLAGEVTVSLGLCTSGSNKIPKITFVLKNLSSRTLLPIIRKIV